MGVSRSDENLKCMGSTSKCTPAVAGKPAGGDVYHLCFLVWASCYDVVVSVHPLQISSDLSLNG